jgi:hypothetical protein
VGSGSGASETDNWEGQNAQRIVAPKKKKMLLMMMTMMIIITMMKLSL